MKGKFIVKINENIGIINAVLLFLPLIGIVTYDTTVRYMFAKPTLWGQELSTFLFGSYILLGGGYTLAKGGHVRVDLIYNKMHGLIKKIVDIIGIGFVILFGIILVWKGGEVAWRSISTLERSGSVWNPPVYPVRCVIPISGLFLFLQACVEFKKMLMEWNSYKPKRNRDDPTVSNNIVIRLPNIAVTNWCTCSFCFSRFSYIFCSLLRRTRGT